MTHTPAKRELFKHEYLIDMNGSAAARRVGVSKESAKYAARDWLAEPDIQEWIDAELAKRAERAGINAEWVLRRAVEGFDKASAKGSHTAARGYLELIGKHVGVKAFDSGVKIDIGETLASLIAKSMASDDDHGSGAE